MPELNKFLKKNVAPQMDDRIPNIPQVLNMKGSKYVRIAQGSEQNAPLQIFDRVLNIPLVLKWQEYREFLSSV